MKILTYENSLGTLVDEKVPVIFLAGPTVRGHQPHLTSWRIAAVEEFTKQGFDGVLVLPQFNDRKVSDKGKLWIPAWEFAGLCASDVNMFWIPRTRELIGLTTNHEHGYWLAKSPDQVVYGRPDDAYRCDYLDVMWQIDAHQRALATGTFQPPRPIYSTLEETVKASIELATERLASYPGPANIYRTKSVIPVKSPFGAF